jgi:proteasome accessory factor B
VATSSVNVNPEDRLFHLILALMSTHHGLTKDHILTTVRGYREDTEAGLSRESIERRFERDKDSLRDLGIPLEAVIPPEDDGNNKNTLYRISKGDYEIPEGITFSQRDIALLNIAAAIWREGSLSKDAHNARIKIASYGAVVDEPLLGFAPIVTTSEPALTPLREAIERTQVVSFDYLKPGDPSATTRLVSPWALVNHEGRWHVYGEEGDKAKTFLLRRITSTVAVTSTAATPAPEGAAETALTELNNLKASQLARVSVTPGSDAYPALIARGASLVEDNVLGVNYTDIDIFGQELTAFGHDVKVLTPPELVERVKKNLERLVQAHG